MADLDEALQIATKAHRGQKDRYGFPFILHPLRVMLRLDTEDEKIVALLHDVLEKSPWTIGDLRHAGFGEKLVAAVDSLTKQAGEAYLDYIDRVSQNVLAKRVKQADLQDHIDLIIDRGCHESEKPRLLRYREAMRTLHAGGRPSGPPR
jgi:(p)ppGpp synthase/HD superfamily hydrolase